MKPLNKSSIPPRGGFEDKIESGIVTGKKSQAHEKLAEFEQQLEATEKKCKFVKNRLEYMKMVYQSVGPTGLETTIFDIPSLNSSKSILINSREIYHQDISKNCRQVDNEDSPVITHANNPVHITKSNKNITANFFTVKRNVTKTKKSFNQNTETGKTSREGVSVVQLATEHVSSQSEDMNSNDNVSKPQEIIIMAPPTAYSSRKSDLILKINNARSSNSNGNKMPKANKLDRVLNSLSTAKFEQKNVDNMDTGRTRKFRKRKARMRRTHSKGVAASGPNIIVQESQFAKRNIRQVNHLRENPKLESDNVTIKIVGEEEKITEQTWNEVVEIYHNTAAKNTSASVVSSKQQFKLGELKSFETTNEKSALVAVDIRETNQNIVHPVKNIKEQNGDYSQAEIDQRICEPPDDDRICRRLEGELNAPSVKRHYGDGRFPCQPPTMRSWYGESFAMRNYQQPTISSKLKQVKRCYIATRVNLRNIPFVVGTSVTPSHNLGLNIQQVFSLIKHRQLSMPSEIRPLLIRKTGEVPDRMIPLAEQLTADDGEEEQQAMSSRQILPLETHFGHAGAPKLSNNHGDSEVSPNITQSSMLRQREEELNIGDDIKKYQSVTNNSGRIRNVLLRLHDQFEAMNDKYAKLQVEVQKTDDPDLRKKLAELDSELTVKEEEISALMDVYKEILALKKQMKLYRERNSVVCITNPGNRKHSTKVGPPVSVRQSRIPFHHLQSFDSQKLRTLNSTREPVTATRLVGLLRQIQLFQQQLTAP